MIYMEAGNAKGSKDAKDMDAQMRVQKCLVALNH